MPDKYTADEIIKMVDKVKPRLKPLHDRMRRDWDYLTLKAFELEQKDVKDGEWDNFTSNSAAVLGNWATTTLATAPLIITIPTTNVKKSERERNSTTELVCYGFIDQANELRGDINEPDIQSALSFDANIRGWTAKLAIVLPKKDGTIKVVISVWDMLNVFWGMGAEGIDWGCHVYYKDAQAAKDEYNVKDVPEDSQGRALCYDHWGCEEEAVVIGSEIIHKYEHKLGYPPVNVRPSGARRLVQDLDDTTTDEAIKFQGESVYLNDRELFDEEQEILTYHKTALGMGVKAPLILYYEGTLPTAFQKNPYVKGRVVPVKKGSEIKELVKPTMPQNTSEFYSLISRQIAQGGISSVVLGAFDSAGPAAGLNILTHAAQNILQAPKKLIEQDFEWICREVIRQYKRGDYKSVELQGTDRLNKNFSIEVSKNDLADNRRIMCKLKPHLPQDEMQKAGIGSAAVRDGALSKQTVRERYYDVQDPDAEQEIIDREGAEDHPAIKLKIRAAKLLKDDPKGNAETAEILNQVADELLNKFLPPKQPQGGQIPGLPTPPNPGALVGQAAEPVIPQDVSQAVRARLGNLGMDYSRG